MCAAERGHYMCAHALANAGADVNAYDDGGSTILMRAIEAESLKCATLLVQAEADVNVFDNYGNKTPLLLAVEGKHTDIVKLLLDAGANANLQDPNNRSAIEVTSCKEDAEILCLLIEAGADLKADGAIALQCAAKNLNYNCMKVLIEAGAKVNGENGDNKVLLDLASAVGSREFSCTDSVKCTQLVFRSGAQINRTDWLDRNGLENVLIELHRNKSRKVGETVAPMLFFAAVEKLHRTVEMEDDIPMNYAFDDTLKRRKLLRFLPLGGRDFSLKHLCRKLIRKHLLQVDKHTNLFSRVTQLGLPLYLPEYLVYDMSLEKEYTFDDSDDDDTDDDVHSDDEESDDDGSSSDESGDGATFDSFSGKSSNDYNSEYNSEEDEEVLDDDWIPHDDDLDFNFCRNVCAHQ